MLVGESMPQSSLFKGLPVNGTYLPSILLCAEVCQGTEKAALAAEVEELCHSFKARLSHPSSNSIHADDRGQTGGGTAAQKLEAANLPVNAGQVQEEGPEGITFPEASPEMDLAR